MTTLKIWHVILLVIVLCAFTELVTFYLRYERCSQKARLLTMYEHSVDFILHTLPPPPQAS